MASTNLVFIGHVSVDDVINLHGRKTQPGGSALYGAIAAKALNVKALLVSAIGEDFPFSDAFDGLNSTYVEQTKRPTTRFTIRYNNNWDADYLHVEIGSGSKIGVSMIPWELLDQQSIIHLSPMKPTKSARIIGRIKGRSPKTKISMSTWLGYLKSKRDRRLLRKLASQIDFFMLNEREAKTLGETNDLPLAIERMSAQRLIVTMGRLGAIVEGDNFEAQMIPALSVPTGKVVDTTGAGDTWNGAFLASYSSTRDLSKSVTVASIISSIKCSGWGFKAIKQLSFKKSSDVIQYVLALRDGSLQKRITDFK
ncbi:MAG: carbohydrate kinase family protein [Candidatus Bathyarchaeota archaeon]|nr:MAG: carbohydrate kinase family protein [Candidatus Bathyarchaeota archaeon]